VGQHDRETRRHGDQPGDEHQRAVADELVEHGAHVGAVDENADAHGERERPDQLCQED
jgi:hypothetical protein